MLLDFLEKLPIESISTSFQVKNGESVLWNAYFLPKIHRSCFGSGTRRCLAKMLSTGRNLFERWRLSQHLWQSASPKRLCRSHWLRRYLRHTLRLQVGLIPLSEIRWWKNSYFHLNDVWSVRNINLSRSLGSIGRYEHSWRVCAWSDVAKDVADR